MKRLLIVMIMLAAGVPVAMAQVTDTVFAEGAGFPGGEEALQNYLEKNLKYPKEASRLKIEGTVILDFRVSEDGTISFIKPIQSVPGGCTVEAIRLVKAMPKWVPGKQNGKIVTSMSSVHINFKLK